jgi:hypothetical protein
LVQLHKVTSDIGKLETPAIIYYRRLPKRKIIMDPSFLELLEEG